uniref:TEN1 subunit of CST complex n=1 Tax=Esox lucius TaxID=8010 RepID=A0AAY5KED9_ESOLU
WVSLWLKPGNVGGLISCLLGPVRGLPRVGPQCHRTPVSVPRLVAYQPEESKATLSAQHAATQHQVVVQTTFVEPFDPIIGAQYIVLGEIENVEGAGVVAVRARVLNCVDGVNLALLQRAINEQRTYFRERSVSEDDVDAHPLAPP